MNDLENDLRELLQRKAGEARATTGAPERVMARGRRRQVGTVFVGLLTTGLLVLASIAGVRGLLRADHGETPGGARRAPFTRTATIEGITVTSPSDWALIDEWPLARSTITSYSASSCSGTATVGPDGGTSSSRQTCSQEAKPSPVAVPAGLPVLQLTSSDLGLGTTICGSGAAGGDSATAGLYVAMNVDAMQRGDFHPGEPGTLDPNATPTSGPCGMGHYATFATTGAVYFAFASFGSSAPPKTTRALADAFDSMKVASVQLQGSPESTPGYVVAGGTSASGEAWRLEVRPTAANVDMELITAAGGASGVADFGVPEKANLEVSGGAGSILFGAITKEASRVELRPDGGGPIVQGTIFSLPTSIDAPFDGFFLDSGSDVVGRRSGQVVAVGPGGDLPEPANGGAGQTPGSVVTTGPTEPGEVRATARGLGETATIRIYRDANGYCLEFTGSSSGTASCGSQPFKNDRPYLSLTHPSAAKGVWLSGIVPADVETVRVIADDGRRWVEDVAGPAKAPDLGDVQLVLAALSGSRGSGTIRFEDANGKELYPPVSFSWPIATSSGNEPL
jgi:hypothetical protein